MAEKIQFAFFGGEPLAVPTLEKLSLKGLVPGLIVCNPDKPSGRNLKLTPPPAKMWAEQHNVPVFQPETLRSASVREKLQSGNWDLFVVAAYSKLIPEDILKIPKHGTLNTHPSLLPKYRGPAPIVAPILNGDTETGTTIILLDKEMDHGPVLAQGKITLQGDEMIEELEKKLADMGGELLAQSIPGFVSGDIQPKEQDHQSATYVKKISKSDGEIDVSGDPVANWRKFRAYAGWPRTYFFQGDKRVIITDAALENNPFDSAQGKRFVIKKVLPEGRKEISYQEFLRQAR